jgi:hypothetical protein
MTTGSASDCCGTGAPVGSGVGMRIFGVAPDLDVVEHRERILGQNRE